MINETLTISLSAISLAVSALTLAVVIKNNFSRHEYDFFLLEHQIKLGSHAGFFAKISCWNAALGGAAPKWHWINPVISTKEPLVTLHLRMQKLDLDETKARSARIADLNSQN